MGQKYNNLFFDLAKSVKGTPMSAWLLLLGIACLLVGINYFGEDMASSRWGLEMLETNYNIEASTWDATFWFGSAALQIFSVLTLFVYLANRTKYWGWAIASFAFQATDVVLDMLYRSRGDFSPFTDPVRALIVFAYTFLVTFILSEGALTFGIGAVAALFEDGADQLGVMLKSIFSGLGKLFGRLMKPKTQRSYTPQQQYNQKTTSPSRRKTTTQGKSRLKRPAPKTAVPDDIAEMMKKLNR